MISQIDFKISDIVTTELSASESMKLMSEAKASVIANSTFSMWGALISQNCDLIITPRIWFRGKIPKSVYLVPQTWIEL
jgi:hypothetical protein